MGGWGLVGGGWWVGNPFAQIDIGDEVNLKQLDNFINNNVNNVSMN